MDLRKGMPTMTSEKGWKTGDADEFLEDIMTEHVHEWVWDIVDNDAWFYCSDKICKAPMGALEIERRQVIVR